MARSSRAALIVIAAVVLVGTAACSSGSEPVVTTTTAAPLLEELSGPGYELDLRNRGATPWNPLLAPAPVGVERIVDVERIEGDLVVSAVIRAEVLRSAADGSAQVLSLELLDAGANDVAVDAGLSRASGATLEIERDRMLAITEQSRIEPQDLGERAALLSEQMLDAVVAVGGPLPADTVGVGAGWTSTLRADDGSTTELRFSLARFDGSRYLIDVTFGLGTAVLEGVVGDALPNRQVLTVADTTTTVLVRNS